MSGFATSRTWRDIRLESVGAANAVLRVFARAAPPQSLQAYADFRTALSTSVLPSDQIAPGTLWLEAMTESKAVSIHLQSSSVIVSGGHSLTGLVACPGARDKSL